MQIRIDRGWHKLLKVYASQDGKSIRDLVEEILSDHYSLSEFEDVKKKK